MHPRFERARTAELRCPGGTIEVGLAEGFGLRLIGLMRLEADEMEPLLFPRCRSIHTYAMKAAIDVVWLTVEGDQARVLEVVESLGPGRHASAPRGAARRIAAALELLPGDAERLGLTAGIECRIKRRSGAEPDDRYWPASSASPPSSPGTSGSLTPAASLSSGALMLRSSP